MFTRPDFFQNVDGTYNEKPDVSSAGGKGSNQAVAASRAGAKTTIITRIGNDDIGKAILENLQFNQIDVSNVEMVNGLSNDYCEIYINIKDKDNDIKRYNGAIDSFTTDMIERYKHVLLNSKIIVCQLKCPKQVTKALINFCYEHNKMLILTPCRPEKLSINNTDDKELIDKIGIITCNKKECQTIFNTSDIEECIKMYPNKLIVTLGSEGLIYHNGNRFVRMPAIDCEVLDTTGAGDTLNGNLSANLTKGLDLKHALRRSMYASAMKLSKKTAQAGMPYEDDLDNFIINTRNKNFKYSKELELAISSVQDAYEFVKYNTNFKIYTKANDTLVTDVDLAIEGYLIDNIKKSFPNDNFVTEENFPDNMLRERTWVIDPIDGTAHFIKNDGLWGIQLAFYDKDSTKFSIIYLPDKKELYYAVENNGAYLNNNKILPDVPSPIKQSMIEFNGSVYKKFDEKIFYLRKLMTEHELLVSGILHINACCIAYTNLISGKTDALISSVDRPWDVMPGELLCKECGIKVIYLDYDKQLRLLSSNNDLKELILSETKSKKLFRKFNP